MIIGDRKQVKNLTAARSLLTSLAVGKDICEIGQEKLKSKERYYETKLLLLERQTVAFENIAAAKHYANCLL